MSNGTGTKTGYVQRAFEFACATAFTAVVERFCYLGLIKDVSFWALSEAKPRSWAEAVRAEYVDGAISRTLQTGPTP